jgi:hypothetical protein
MPQKEHQDCGLTVKCPATDCTRTFSRGRFASAVSQNKNTAIGNQPGSLKRGFGRRMNITALTRRGRTRGESFLPVREEKTMIVSRGRALCVGGLGKCNHRSLQKVKRENSGSEPGVDRYQ